MQNDKCSSHSSCSGHPEKAHPLYLIDIASSVNLPWKAHSKHSPLKTWSSVIANNLQCSLICVPSGHLVWWNPARGWSAESTDSSGSTNYHKGALNKHNTGRQSLSNTNKSASASQFYQELEPHSCTSLGFKRSHKDTVRVAQWSLPLGHFTDWVIWNRDVPAHLHCVISLWIAKSTRQLGKPENQIPPENQTTPVPPGVISVLHSPCTIQVQRIKMVKSCYKISPFWNCQVMISEGKRSFSAALQYPGKGREFGGGDTLHSLFFLKQFECSAHSAWEALGY